MSALIERLEALKSRIHLAYVEQDSRTRICKLNELNQLLWDEFDTILAALKTVQGIETLLSKGDKEVFINTLSGSGKLMVFFSDTDEGSNHVLESTLSLAIEAAMKATEKGAK